MIMIILGDLGIKMIPELLSGKYTLRGRSCPIYEKCINKYL